MNIWNDKQWLHKSQGEEWQEHEGILEAYYWTQGNFLYLLVDER